MQFSIKGYLDRSFFLGISDKFDDFLSVHFRSRHGVTSLFFLFFVGRGLSLSYLFYFSIITQFGYAVVTLLAASMLFRLLNFIQMKLSILALDKV